MRTVIVEQTGLTLDLVVWRVLGKTAGVVEETLGLNPGLAGAGVVLPLGTIIRLPDPSAEPPRLAVVNLWT